MLLSYGFNKKAMSNYGPIRVFISEAEAGTTDSMRTWLHFVSKASEISIFTMLDYTKSL